MPLFSLVIPTLRRPDTLQHSLATLLRQPRPEVEIIVQNNGDDLATRRLVERVGDERVRHCSSDRVLAMCENWERALDSCRGEWIIFIGDDDGLLPDA
jgi:glycosyltransferase involved in cell wall biosynthesis